jgi:glucose/arabinose dehydrogenase
MMFAGVNVEFSGGTRMSVAVRGLMAVAGCALMLAVGAPAAGAATVPPNFDVQVLSAFNYPTGLAYTPDGRFLLASQTGQLWVYKNGTTLSTPAIDLADRVCTQMERGLEGVAVDPDFATNHFVYLYYTHKTSSGACGTDPSDPSSTPSNRVSRFVLGSNDLIDPNSERVLIDNIPNPAGVHNGGDLHFGKDDYL